MDAIPITEPFDMTRGAMQLLHLDDEKARSIAPEVANDQPRYDAPIAISDATTHWQVTCKLGDVCVEDVHVQLAEGCLLIYGDLRASRPGAEATPSDPSYGWFVRALQLPANSSEDGVAARLEGTELQVTVPKRQVQSRKIPVERVA